MSMKVNEHRIAMKRKARAIRGLVSVLQDDAEYMRADSDDFDLVGLNESIREAKDTVNLLIDHIVELEYLVYLVRDGIGGDEYDATRSYR